jgi:hypothetical protein
MECLPTHVDWNTQVIPIMLSGDRLKKVTIDEGDGCVHPSAHTGADSHDQPRSRPRCMDVGRASAGESGKSAPRARRISARRRCCRAMIKDDRDRQGRCSRFLEAEAICHLTEGLTLGSPGLA